MDTIQVIVLALVQGISEFLPISSSAHLILTSELLNWPNQGAAFDVAVHVGTLIAVMGYFWRDIYALLNAWFRSLFGQHSPLSKLAWAVIIGTLPLIPAGFAIKAIVGEMPRWPLLIATTTIIFGLLLWWADSWARKASLRKTSLHAPNLNVEPANDDLQDSSIGWRKGLIIGCAQAIALLPGTSRSGVTMTAGLFLGLSRTAAARFSFLLSVPAILMGGAASTLDVFDDPGIATTADMLIGALVAGGFAALTIHLFMRLIESIGMLPFVIYRLLLGGFLLAMIAFGGLNAF